jgi:hypothetical protein
VRQLRYGVVTARAGYVRTTERLPLTVPLTERLRAVIRKGTRTTPTAGRLGSGMVSLVSLVPTRRRRPATRSVAGAEARTHPDPFCLGEHP